MAWSLVRVGPVSQQRKVLFGKRELPAPSIQGHGDITHTTASGDVTIIDVDASVEEPSPGVEAEAEESEGHDQSSDEVTFLIAAEASTTTSRRRKPARKPTPEEVEGWRRAAMAARRDMNFDGTLSEDGRMTLGETLASPEPSAEDEYASAQLTAMVAERLAELHADLNAKEQVILQDRLLADEGRTLQEVGDQFGISRERVRQIEANLKKKIAKRLENLSPIGLLEPPR